MLQAALRIVQAEIQDVPAGLELRFHGEFLGEREEPAGVLRQGLVQGPGAVAAEELPARRHLHELHLHPQEGIGVVDLQYFIPTQTACRIWPQMAPETSHLMNRKRNRLGRSLTDQGELDDFKDHELSLLMVLI